MFVSIVGMTMLGTISAALAVDINEIKARMKSGNCPRNLVTISDLSYHPDCDNKSDSKAYTCMLHIDALNRTIYDYNDFVRKCREGQSPKSATAPKSGSGNAPGFMPVNPGNSLPPGYKPVNPDNSLPPGYKPVNPDNSLPPGYKPLDSEDDKYDSTKPGASGRSATPQRNFSKDECRDDRCAAAAYTTTENWRLTRVIKATCDEQYLQCLKDGIAKPNFDEALKFARSVTPPEPEPQEQQQEQPVPQMEAPVTQLRGCSTFPNNGYRVKPGGGGGAERVPCDASR